MDKVPDDLNVKVQDQCRSFLAKDVSDYNKTDIDKLIDQINPEIWKAICMLTRSVSERRGTSKSLTNPASSTNHIKVRRFFLLCAMMYCTDDRRSLPMHTLITDLIDSQGGTAHLIKVLNRLGVCASLVHWQAVLII